EHTSKGADHSEFREQSIEAIELGRCKFAPRKQMLHALESHGQAGNAYELADEQGFGGEEVAHARGVGERSDGGVGLAAFGGDECFETETLGVAFHGGEMREQCIE